jgi:hypothetical protein
VGKGARLYGPLAGIAAALPLALWLRGFMVDDALIEARYAANLAAGAGYRFNVGGPVTDGVTPLGWPLLLAPFASGGVLAAFAAAKLLGLAAWLIGAALLGVAVASLEGGFSKWGALGLVAVSAPLGAWCNAGMETGIVLGLAAAAVSARTLGRERLAMAAAGLVAAWRPECLPWAAVLALAPARDPARAPSWIWRVLVAAGPFFLVCATRLAVFGRATPLALLAKPSDLRHGAVYAGACLVATGAAALLAWPGLPGWVRGLQAATLIQFASVAIAGGDWMPLARLVVPVLPGLVIAAAAIAGRARVPLALARLGLGLAGPVWVASSWAPVAAEVGPKRMAVVRELAPALADAHAVAALDVGWVGAATSAPIVDLAGVTDPAVAVLEGGHTTKRVPHTLFDARGVDTIVLLLADGAPLEDPWTHTAFARWVELWVAHMPSMAARFRPAATSEGALRYVVLKRVD